MSSSSHLEKEPLLLVGTQAAQLCRLFQEEQEVKRFYSGVIIAQKMGNVPDTPDLRRLGSAVEDEGPGSPGSGSSN